MKLSDFPKKKLEAYSQITKIPASQIDEFEEFFLDKREEAVRTAKERGEKFNPKRAGLPKFKVYAQTGEDEWYCIDTTGGNLVNANCRSAGDAVTFLEYGEIDG